MIIVRDIVDATTVRDTLASLMSRAILFGKTRDQILEEIDLLVEDLDCNIDRIDREMEKLLK